MDRVPLHPTPEQIADLGKNLLVAIRRTMPPSRQRSRHEARVHAATLAAMDAAQTSPSCTGSIEPATPASPSQPPPATAGTCRAC